MRCFVRPWSAGRALCSLLVLTVIMIITITIMLNIIVVIHILVVRSIVITVLPPGVTTAT